MPDDSQRSTNRTTTPNEPPRPTLEEADAELDRHVRELAGPDAVPRPEQRDAVRALVCERRRTLLVARTGFGKSAVYFSATRMLRDRGWGPTVVVSPLLALMRDQIAQAERLGLRAATVNSSNLDDWDEVEAAMRADEVDLLLISPERLANQRFRARVFDTLLSSPFALVCDEAHCISDWGHDFRPDYRRLRQLLDELPSWTPVLATTATANQRVSDDIAEQLGDRTVVVRTSLDRDALRLSVVDLPTDAARLAWLADTLPEIPGSGIVYCLTVAQADTTARWLLDNGRAVAAYTGATDPADRERLEDALRANELEALVATSALGMGFDKGDLAFCIHLGLPASPIAYYQQIGRAGRALQRAEAIALPRGEQDAAVWRWFESVGLPSEDRCRTLLDQLDSVEPTSIGTLETVVNLGRTRLSTLLSILDVDGAVERVGGGWVRTAHPWTYDHDLARSLIEVRRREADQMRTWAGLDSCRLQYLREALDDPHAEPCGRCDRCTDHTWQREPDPLLVARASELLRESDVVIEPRRQWPTGLADPKGRIPAERQARPGRALCRRGDGGWDPLLGPLIESPGPDPTLPDDLVPAIARVLKRWPWDERPTWICPVPSRRNAALVDAVCAELGRLGKLPVHPALERDDTGGPQAEQANSAHQVTNLWGHLTARPEAIPDSSGPVLLVDDEVDSRWTVAVASWELTGAGSGAVLPFSLRTR